MSDTLTARDKYHLKKYGSIDSPVRLAIKNGGSITEHRDTLLKQFGNGVKDITANNLSPLQPQVDYSFAPGSYKLPQLSQQELNKRLWAEQVAKSKLRQKNNTTSEMIGGKHNPNAKMGLEIVSPEFMALTAGVGSLGNMATSTAGKIGAAATHGAGQGAMANMSNLSGSKQDLSGLATDVLGGAVGGAVLKGVGLSAKPVAKYALQKAEPYLMGDKNIPMTGYKPKQQFWNTGKNKTTNSIEDNINELFKSNPELQKIGTPQQYLEHLKSIYPDFNESSISYHGTKNNFSDFAMRRMDEDVGAMNGAYFTKDIKYAKSYGPQIKRAILDIKNPLITEGKWTGIIDDNVKQKISNKGYDSVINNKFDNGKFDNFLYKLNLSKPRTEEIVFNGNQIYELGATGDLDNFLKFTSKSKKAFGGMINSF